MSEFTSADEGEHTRAQAAEGGFAPLDAQPADAPPPQQQDAAPFAPPYPAPYQQSNPYAQASPYQQPNPYAQPGQYQQPSPYGTHPQAPVPPWPGSQAPLQAGAQPVPPAGWNPAAYGFPPMASAPLAPAPKRSKGRLWGVAGAVVAVAGLVTGVLLVTGSHSAAPTAGAPIAGATASDSATSTSASDGSGQGLLTGSLTSALLPLPSGATSLNETDTGPGGSLTLDQYLKLLYPTSTTERAALQRRDFIAAADRLFRTSTGSAEVFLIQFQAATGAESYGLALSAAHHRDHASDPSFTIPGLTNGTGYEESALDSYGNTRSFVYGSLGNVTVLIHFYTPATLDRTALMSIVSAQITHLQAAEG